jgi:energy-coupling factor transport system permease protein
MRTNVTVGQYYPADSIVHKLDPRLKIAGTFAFMTALFAFGSPFTYLCSFIFLCFLVILSKVPVKALLGGLKSIFALLAFTLIINMFMSRGEDIFFRLGFLKLTYTGLSLAGKMAVRLIMLVLAGSVLTLSTSPIELTDAIEYLLAPLKKIGVPSHEIAMMTSVALRFIPTLTEEMEKIIKAQKARGANFETGSLINRAKGLIPILIPLLLSSIKRAEDLANAMEARCYRGGEGRSKYKIMKFKTADRIGAVLLVIFLCVVAFFF